MRAAFHTLGCKTNAYETQAILEQFERAGFEIGSFSEPCDVYVINTCAVTAEAARKSRQMIGRCRKNNPDAMVVVTGCYAQETGEDALMQFQADLVVGNSSKSRIAALTQEYLKNREEQTQNIYVQDLSRCREYESQHITYQEQHVRAYVKIQDGCDRFCSYCLIPFLRGRSRSRRMEEIEAEVRDLSSEDYHEVVLTGIDISSFDGDLALLTARLADIPGIRRIRLGSLEAGIVTEDFVRALSEVPAFCPQFHLSLQSGCDTVLARMNRKYTTAEYEQAVDLIRGSFPKAAVTTDLIVGFPGETEEEFQATLQFAERIGFSRIHVFPYSEREKTRAAQMPGRITRRVKEERASELIRLGEQLKRAYEEPLIGKPCSILAEELFADSSGCYYLAGYTPEYVRILVREETVLTRFLTEPYKLINQFITVRPEGFSEGTLCL